MTIFVIAYAIGFLFHAVLASLEMKQVIKTGYHVTMYDHVRATALIIFWPLLVIEMLIEAYADRIKHVIHDNAKPGN